MHDESPWENVNKEKLICILTEELPSLKAKIGVTQEELSNIIGISCWHSLS